MSDNQPDYYRVISTPCCDQNQTVHLGTYDNCLCCGRIFHFTWAGTIRMKVSNVVMDCEHLKAHEEVG